MPVHIGKDVLDRFGTGVTNNICPLCQGGLEVIVGYPDPDILRSWHSCKRCKVHFVKTVVGGVVTNAQCVEFMYPAW